MASSSSAALRVVVPEPGGLGEPLRVTHSLTGGAGPPRPPAGPFSSVGISSLTWPLTVAEHCATSSIHDSGRLHRQTFPRLP